MDELLLWAAALAAVAALAERWSRSSARRGARKTLEHAEALFSGSHEYQSVDPSRFDWLDLGFYERTKTQLEAEGFRFLGDVENLTLTRQHASMRTFIRVMSGDRGQVMVGLYQIRLRGPAAVLQWIGVVPRRVRVLDFETELDDGRFLVTTNTGRLDTTPIPASVQCERLPLSTPAARLLARHRERLREVLASGAGARRVDSLNEALAAADRIQRLKNEVMGDREALVQTIAEQPGLAEAKRLLIDEVRRSQPAGPRTR